MTNLPQFHSPDEVIFLVRDGAAITATVLSHFGRLSIPLHADQARKLMAAAERADQVEDFNSHAGRRTVTFRRGNRLLSAANPAGYGEPEELLALVVAGDRYLAWVAGEGATFRVISDREAHAILRRARGFHTRTRPVILRQAAYLFARDNDLAVTILADDVPVEWEVVPANAGEVEEFAAVFGRKLLNDRLAGAWAAGVL